MREPRRAGTALRMIRLATCWLVCDRTRVNMQRHT